MKSRESRLYMLSDKDPVQTNDVLAWCTWFEKADRTVAQTRIADTRVLTSFTGINREWRDQTVLWETTISGGEHHGLGQQYTSEEAARFGHTLWDNVARGTVTPDYVKKICPVSAQFLDREEGAWRADESSTWLAHYEVPSLLDVSERTLAHYEHLGMLHPRRITHEDPYQRSYIKKTYHTITLYDILEVIDLCRRNSKLSRRSNYRRPAELPQHLKPLHATILDSYVTPGVITLIEFRVRYGYQCKRIACRHCQANHYDGPWGSCRNKDSGTRYRVNRADGTIVCAELSALQAWKTAHRLEQGRLMPILVARDALVEGRVDDAMELANQLSSDLAVPLRREITNATASPELADERLEDA